MVAAAVLLVVGLSVQAEEDRQGLPDPLMFSTFVGGTGVEWPHAVEVADNGSIYVTGYTLSFDFPTTEGAYQRVTKGKEEVYVLHLSPDGSELLWATLIGGTGQDIAWDIAVGADGRVYVTGETLSPDFPTTKDAYLRTREGGSDAFVVCLSPDGGSLVYSTLLGGEDDDEGFSIEALADRRVYVAGSTGSVFFPTTNGAHDRALGGVEDVFVSRLSSDGRTLEASTYLGGSYTEKEPSMVIDGSGNLWLAGSTTSQDFPTTAGLPNDWSLARDVFVAAIDGDLTQLKRATVVGQIGSDVPRSIDIGPQGEVLVAGYTHSPEFPTTGPEPGNDNSGNWDGFMLVYGNDLTTRHHEWLYGGDNYDVIRAARYDPRGLIHATGYTNSTNFPTTLGSYDPYKSGDDHDMFYMQVDPDSGYSTVNSTYIGKNMGDFGMAMSFNPWGIPIIAGHSRSDGFPTEGDPYDSTHAGNGDIVVLKYTTDEDPPEFSNDTTPGQVETGANITFSVDVHDSTGIFEVWLYIVEDRHDFQRPDSILMEGNGIHSFTMGLSGSSLGLRYRFMAWDVLGHISETEFREIDIVDTIPPSMLSDKTPGEGTTGDPFEFRFEAYDNWFVELAKVEYVIGEMNWNSTMSTFGSDHGFAEWFLTIELANSTLDPIDYRFHFMDQNTMVSTGWVQVQVRDNDAPMVSNLSLPLVVLPETWLTVDVFVIDNIGIASVWLEHYVEIGQEETVTIDGPYGSRVVTELRVPRGRGDLHISIHVEDDAGNIGVASGMVQFRDDDPPELTVHHENTTSTGESVTITWSASDPAGIHSMWGFYVFGYGHGMEEYTYFQAEEIPTVGTRISVPEDSLEPLLVVLGAKDLYGNENLTGTIEIQVLDGNPPKASAGPDMVVSPGEVVLLDARSSEDNIGISNYSWSWIDPSSNELVVVHSERGWIEANITRVGTYDITLEVTDLAGNTASDGMVVQVRGEGEEEPNRLDMDAIVMIAVAIVGLTLLVLFLVLKSRS
jgi:hypothetical protein